MPPIEFWFDFSSGYAYFAAREAEALAARVGRRMRWRPFMLGAAFAVTGARGLSSTPLKQDYAARDWARLARLHGAPFAPPPGHPAIALAATRAFYVIEDADAAAAPRFARAAFDAYYAGRLDTADPAAVADFAGRHGADPERVLAGMTDPALKARVKALGEEAVARGVFGSPYFVVDGEPFWGFDRMAMMEDWIVRGGW